MARASCKAMSLCRKRVTPCMVSTCTGCATAPSRVFARCFQFHSWYMVGTDSTDSIPSGQHCIYIYTYIYIQGYTGSYRSIFGVYEDCLTSTREALIKPLLLLMAASSTSNGNCGHAAFQLSVVCECSKTVAEVAPS